jgi:hypothetical protein
MQKRNIITITYNAKPDVPSEICHKFPLMELTKVRTRKFDASQWREAWTFMSECTSSITTLKQLIFAMPRNIGKKILDLLEEKTLIDDHGKWVDANCDDFEYVDLNNVMHYSTEE